MKNVLKIVLLLVLCVAMMASCDLFGPKEEETTTQAPEETTTGNPDGPDDPNPDNGGETPVELLEIVKADATTDYKIIVGDCVDSELWSNFSSDVLKMTRMATKFSQYKETSRPKDDFEITLNVRKGDGREDVIAVFKNQDLTTWTVQVIGNRVVVNAMSKAGLKEAFKQLKNSFQKDENGAWGIPKDLSLSGETLGKTKLQWALMSDEEKEGYNAVMATMKNLPFFETKNGAFNSIYPTGDNGYSVAITNGTKAEYDTYLDQIRALGYSQYSVNAMSDGGKKENVYHTFVSDTVHIFTQWQSANAVIRVSVQPAGALPSLEKVECTAEDNVPVTIAQTQLAINSFGGMGYVYQLADGKLIVVDGGTSHQMTNEILMGYIKQKAAEAGMEKPVIAMWIFSHPHGDHIGVASSDFLEKAKADGIVIESFGYNFAEQTYHPDNHASAVSVLEQLIEDNYPEATIYKFHTGQVYYFKGMSIEIIGTQEDVYPLQNPSEQNDLCVNWRVHFENGKTAMFLADASIQNCRELAKVYGSYLKSDILQMAHHGLSGAELECYKAIDPDICLWPSPYTRFMDIYPGNVLFPNEENPADGLVLNQDQWGLGFRFVLNSNNKPIDMDGNETNDPAKAQKTVISAPNLWLLDESIKKRADYHNSETTIIGADMSVKIQRVADSSLYYDLPENEENLTKIGEGVYPGTEWAYVLYEATGFDYKSLDDIPGGKETITNWDYYFGEK